MPTALVTGCNKGIGFYIAQGLCKKEYEVVMGCRNVSKAEEAELSIKAHCPHAIIHRVTLDLTDIRSVGAAVEAVKLKYPHGLDILVNNAGFAYHSDSTVPFSTQAEDSVSINYKGTRAVCEGFASLMKIDGRIVNVSSRAGSLSLITNHNLRERWLSANSTEEIDMLIQEFLSHTEKGDYEKLGWPHSAYGVSKLALTTYTRVLAKLYPQLHVYACCPGWCRTDMSTNTGTKSAAEGADTPLWLASSKECLETIPTGSFVAERHCL